MLETDYHGIGATLIRNQSKGLRTMVKSEHYAPVLVGRAGLNLHHPIYKPPMTVPLVVDLDLRFFARVGGANAKGQTGVNYVVPRKFFPTTDDRQVELPVILVTEVTYDLALDLEAKPIVEPADDMRRGKAHEGGISEV